MFIVLKGELKKYLHEVRTYYPDHLVSMIITFIIFAVFFKLYQSPNDPAYYLGFVYWYLLESVISEASVSISMEKQLGTLEQLLLKPINIEWLMIVKTLVWTMINMVKVSLVMLFLKVCFQIKMTFSLLILPIFFMSMIGVLGFTLILVALTLKYTKTASFESIISYALLFLTGAIIPYESLPDWVQGLGNFLPISLAIESSKKLINTGSLEFSAFLILCLQSILYFLIGYLIFKYIYKKSRISGIDNAY